MPLESGIQKFNQLFERSEVFRGCRVVDDYRNTKPLLPGRNQTAQGSGRRLVTVPSSPKGREHTKVENDTAHDHEKHEEISGLDDVGRKPMHRNTRKERQDVGVQRHGGKDQRSAGSDRGKRQEHCNAHETLEQPAAIGQLRAALEKVNKPNQSAVVAEMNMFAAHSPS
jgi:hypothetical protein